jgi:CRAL/TRIO domain
MLKWFTPNNMKIASAKAELIPAKQMHFHVVNSSALMNTTVSLVFPFLGQNIKDHVHFHYTDWASLHQHVDKEALPTEYGGTVDTDPTELYAQLEKCPQLSTDFLKLSADFSKKLDLTDKDDKKSGKSKSKKEKV